MFRVAIKAITARWSTWATWQPLFFPDGAPEADRVVKGGSQGGCRAYQGSLADGDGPRMGEAAGETHNGLTEVGIQIRTRGSIQLYIM
jgi:hypothetical protein